MGIYIGLLAFALISGFLWGRNRALYVFLVFSALIFVAALRSDSVGVDLSLHYASNYEIIAKNSWDSVGLYFVGTGQYDIGFAILCKLLGMISIDRQWFIIATSIIVYGSFAKFIYRYSSDVVLDTVLMVTTFSFFQYMCIIAQAVAIAIVLNGISFLKEKKYIKYIAVVLLASTVHASAIICLIFILLQRMELKRKNIVIYGICVVTGLVLFEQLMPIVVNTFFSSYSFYIGQEKHGMSTGLGPTGISYLVTFALCAGMGIFCQYGRKRALNEVGHERTNTVIFKIKNIEVGLFKDTLYQKFELNFLIYMAFSAFFFYAGSLQMEASRRFLYYFSPFAYIAAGQSLGEMQNQQLARLLKIAFYVFTILCFLMLGENMARSGPGVVPYSFFWE